MINYAIEKKGSIPKFIQYVFIHDCKSFYKIFTSDILSEKEFLEFRKGLTEFLSYVDEKISINHFFINRATKSFIIYLKNDEFHIEVDSGKFFLKSNDYVITPFHEVFLVVDVIEIIEDNINFSLQLNSSCD